MKTIEEELKNLIKITEQSIKQFISTMDLLEQNSISLVDNIDYYKNLAQCVKDYRLFLEELNNILEKK